METEDEDDVVDTPDSIEKDDLSSRQGDTAREAAKSAARIRHKSDVYIAEGVYTDCENILKQFLAKQTSTFEDFVAIWQEKKFSLIFNGRDSYAEVLEFSEEVLTIAKFFILPPHSQIKRIGALYLMYGLYAQQPYRDTAKFRVTPQEWSVILKFVDNLKAHGFIDANYIFHKMCLDGAFLTVAYTREYGLERNYRKYLTSWQARDKELEPGITFSLDNLMGRVYRGSLKSAADKLRSKYNSIKSILADKKETNFQSLKGTDQELEHVMLNNLLTLDNPSETLGDAKKLANLGGDRRDIINKAFQQKTHPKVSKCALLFEPPDMSAASTSQATIERTTNSQSEILELESDSEGNDFRFVINPPSLRNNKKRKSRTSKRGKSQDQELARTKNQEPALGHNRPGPYSLDFCFEEVTGMKGRSHKKKCNKSPNPVITEVDQTKTATPTEVEEVIDTCQGSDSFLSIDIDGAADPQVLSKDPEGSNLKSPASSKGRKNGKQGTSVSVPSLDTGAGFNCISKDPLSSVVDTTATVQTKNNGKRKSAFKIDLTAQNDSCPHLENPDGKAKRSSRRLRKTTDSSPSSGALEDKLKKTTRRSRKSCELTIDDSCPSSETPEDKAIKSTRSRISSEVDINNSGSRSEISDVKLKKSMEEPRALDTNEIESAALSPKTNTKKRRLKKKT